MILDDKKIEEAARRYSEVTDCDKQESLLIEEGFKEGAEVGLSSQTGYVWNAYMRSYPLRSGINSVSDLQHLLFGLGINHEMEV